MSFSQSGVQQFEFDDRRASPILDPRQLDTSLLKQFNITETTYFQLRIEALNVLNHPSFTAPNVVATNGSFGLITTQLNRSRALQLGVRFGF